MDQTPLSDEAPLPNPQTSETTPPLTGKALKVAPLLFTCLILFWIYTTGLVQYWIGLWEYEKQRHEAKAIMYFNWALAANPRLAGAFAHRGRAKADLEEKKGAKANYEDALNDLGMAIHFNPKQLSYLESHVRICELAKDYKKEIADYSILIPMSLWRQDEYRNTRASLYELVGEPALARADREAIIEAATAAIKNDSLEGNDGPTHYSFTSRADQYKFLGELDKAIQDYDQATKIDAGPDGCLKLGYLLEKTERDSEAIAAYTKAIDQPKVPQTSKLHIESAMAPFDSDKACYRRANLYLKHKQYSKALEDADRLIRNVDSAERHAFRAKILNQMGEVDRAIKEKQETLAKFNQSEKDDAEEKQEKYFDRAELYEQLGEYKNALRDYTTAYSLQPTDSDSEYTSVRCAQMYCKLGDYDNAIKWFSKSIETAADPYLIQSGYVGLAEAHLKIDRPILTIEDCNKAIAAYPSEGAGYHWRALAYRKLGKTDLAKADEIKAVALDFSPLPELNGTALLTTKEQETDTDP